MKLINIGFGNLVSAERVLAIVSPDSAPLKRLIQESRERGMLLDATYGRKTASVFVMDSDHVVLLDKTVLKQGKPDDVFASPEFQKVFGLGAKTLNAQRLHGAERWMGRKAETPEEEIARAAAVVDDETKGGQA